jgi:hypothetical protein
VSDVSINLMEPSERRYQGPVSGRFLMFTTVGTVLAAVFLSIAVQMYDNRSLTGQLNDRRQRWSEREPRYKAVLSMRNDTAALAKILGELNGWQSARLEWHKGLRLAQRHVGSGIQLTTLDLRDPLTEPPVPAGGTAEKQPYCQFTLLISGRSSGENPETAVVRFIQALRDSPAPVRLFRDLTLQSIQKDVEGPSSRVFSIKGVGMERELK